MGRVFRGCWEAMNLSGNVISSNNGSRNGMAVSGLITGTPTWQLDAGFPYIVSYSGWAKLLYGEFRGDPDLD